MGAATLMRRSALDWLERCPDAQGTMFVWAKIPERFASSVDFAIELMEKTGVIVVPGSAFGAQGEGYVRMALVVPARAHGRGGSPH